MSDDADLFTRYAMKEDLAVQRSSSDLATIATVTSFLFVMRYVEDLDVVSIMVLELMC